MRSDHRHLTAYQIGCEVGQSVVLVMRPAIFNRHVLALDVTGVCKAPPKRGHKVGPLGSGGGVNEPHHRYRLLRARRERPRRRTAEQGDESAALHSITS